MDRDDGSQTAFLVCGFRALASARPLPVCNDPWAAALGGEEALELARQFGGGAWKHGELWIALRTAAIDREVLASVDAGVRQVVILGAGLDARAARLSRPGARYFEVDHPLSQARKRERVAAAGYPGDVATMVSCDFAREDFLDRLVAAGFQVDTPSVVVWEGVVLYLEEAAVRGTLRRLATGCHPASRVVFDHVGKKLATGLARRPDDVAVVNSLDGVGEPIRYGVDDVLPVCFDAGFRHVRTRSFDELALAFTGTYDRERAFRFQGLTVASVASP